MRRSTLFALILLVVIGGLLAVWRGGHIPARFDPLAPLDLAEALNPVTAAKLWLMEGNNRACVSALRRAGVALIEMPKRSTKPDCALNGTVLISRLSRASFNPEEMRCDMALRLYLFERHGIQPLAQKHLGAAVTRINHFGSYSCRTIAGSDRMSEHATANAFDISGFTLGDGKTVTLKRDWTGGGASSRFLHDLRVRACLLFNLVLSPDYNADHEDHFHLDMGRHMACH